MEDLKIRVSNEEESREAQELFFELGFKKGVVGRGCYPMTIVAVAEPEFVGYPFSSSATRLDHEAHKHYKQLTLLELKDLVVLKRNDVGDSNAYCSDNNEHYFITSRGDYYFFFKEKSEWYKSSNDISYLKCHVKPIKEEVMKEYLDPDNGYDLIKWTGFAHPPESFIEVPDGAYQARYYSKDHLELEFENSNRQWWDNDNLKWVNYSDNEYFNSNKFSKIVWKREKESIIDKLVDDLPEFKHNAESEKRSHGHYFKDVSQLNEIDVYHVLKLFEVTDPCLQHIVKKALCAGKRGHKDMMEDLQNIVDTAIRAVELNK